MVSGGANCCARPILFSGPMVRAVLDGRKTQTRRIARLNVSGRVGRGEKNWHPDDPNAVLACPFGQVGNRLWVRETWLNDPFGKTHYRADGHDIYDPVEDRACPWKPSIHMPRLASRITLEITAVRLERLHKINEADASEEGAFFVSHGDDKYRNRLPGWNMDPEEAKRGHTFCLSTARWAFANFWEKLNGVNSWDANPLVWVVSFRVV